MGSNLQIKLAQLAIDASDVLTTVTDNGLEENRVSLDTEVTDMAHFDQPDALETPIDRDDEAPVSQAFACSEALQFHPDFALIDDSADTIVLRTEDDLCFRLTIEEVKEVSTVLNDMLDLPHAIIRKSRVGSVVDLPDTDSTALVPFLALVIHQDTTVFSALIREHCPIKAIVEIYDCDIFISRLRRLVANDETGHHLLRICLCIAYGLYDLVGPVSNQSLKDELDSLPQDIVEVIKATNADAWNDLHALHQRNLARKERVQKRLAEECTVYNGFNDFGMKCKGTFWGFDKCQAFNDVDGDFPRMRRNAASRVITLLFHDRFPIEQMYHVLLTGVRAAIEPVIDCQRCCTRLSRTFTAEIRDMDQSWIRSDDTMSGQHKA